MLHHLMLPPLTGLPATTTLPDNNTERRRADGSSTPTPGTTTPTPGSATPPLLSAEKPLKYEPQLSLTPYCNTKVIHFIRHGWVGGHCTPGIGCAGCRWAKSLSASHPASTFHATQMLAQRGPHSVGFSQNLNSACLQPFLSYLAACLFPAGRASTTWGSARTWMRS